jgi:hypothetical protein
MVGEVIGKKGLFISASFQGHGMVLCFMCAKAVVQMMCNEGNNKNLDIWFPNAYKITEERMRNKFEGRSHAKPQVIEASATL